MQSLFLDPYWAPRDFKYNGYKDDEFWSQVHLGRLGKLRQSQQRTILDALRLSAHLDAHVSVGSDRQLQVLHSVSFRG